jgi:hypothetical protein
MRLLILLAGGLCVMLTFTGVVAAVVFAVRRR